MSEKKYKKVKRLNVVMNELEAEMLLRVCEEQSMTRSEAIRFLIRKENDANTKQG